MVVNSNGSGGQIRKKSKLLECRSNKLKFLELITNRRNHISARNLSCRNASKPHFHLLQSRGGRIDRVVINGMGMAVAV